jgi:murein DD-endopeptidase MepM/ murein hydrolase activator NlpD
MGPVRVMLGAMLLLAPLGTARADDGPDVTILSAYSSLAGANELPRLRPHAGVDLAAAVGTPVLAAADGTVSLLIDYEMGCGNGVVLAHPAFRRWTAYCHLTRALVTTGQVVSRGQAIGLSGTSGNSANVPHVHLEVCTVACASHRDGDLRGTQDPLPLIVGCFEAERAYPTDRLALTWPLGCRRGTADARR